MRPLSPVDVMFLWAENRRQPMHVAGLQLYTPPPGAGPDFVQQLLERFREHTQAAPPFDRRAVFRLGHWFWDTDHEFELDYHLRHSALPRPGRIRELLALVSRLHGSLMDRSRPLWELHVIEGLADGRVALYAKIHHGLIDGVAAVQLMQSVLSTDPDERRPPLWAQVRPEKPARAATAPGLLGPLLEAMRVGAEIVPGIGSGLRELVRATQTGGGSDGAPFSAPPTLFNVPISGSRRFAAQSYSLERLRALGKSAGATLNDITLAVCAGALRRYLLVHSALPAQPLTAMVPVSIRGEQEGGNQIAMMVANLATNVEDPAKRLARIMESTRRGKDRLGAMSPLERVAYAAAMGAPFAPSVLTGHARRRPIFNVVISNVPGPRAPLYLDGMRLDEIYPVSIPFEYLALNITINSYCDHLGFGYTACRRSVPALQRMLDHTDEALRELEAALA
jgi:diacylglycerol O-acyltransferase